MHLKGLVDVISQLAASLKLFLRIRKHVLGQEKGKYDPMEKLLNEAYYHPTMETLSVHQEMLSAALEMVKDADVSETQNDRPDLLDGGCPPIPTFHRPNQIYLVFYLEYIHV